MRKIENLKELSEQIDLFAMRAQKWLPDLKQYIYKDAADTFSDLQDLERAQKYSKLYQNELKKMASH